MAEKASLARRTARSARVHVQASQPQPDAQASTSFTPPRGEGGLAPGAARELDQSVVEASVRVGEDARLPGRLAPGRPAILWISWHASSRDAVEARMRASARRA